MKKITLLMAAFIFLLSGCGSSNPTPEKKSQSNKDLSLEAPLESEKPQEIFENSPDPNPAVPEKNAISQETSGTDKRVTLKLVVPEGYTLARIGMTLHDMGVCTTTEFIDAAENGDFSGFPLIKAQEYNPNRAFKLEGYLFPATYEIYADDPPDTIIRKMLTHTETKIPESLRQEIYSQGFTLDQILILASIIEKEAYERNNNPVPQEMPRISSVLHNRLEEGMPLQCDVTINYVEGAIKPFINGDKDRYNVYYNTYKAPTLPAGAICNPGLDAILAAARPSNTDYLFFLTDDDKNFYYSATYEEHQVLVEKYLYLSIKKERPSPLLFILVFF